MGRSGVCQVGKMTPSNLMAHTTQRLKFFSESQVISVHIAQNF